jgi:hypothetical protein
VGVTVEGFLVRRERGGCKMEEMDGGGWWMEGRTVKGVLGSERAKKR